MFRKRNSKRFATSIALVMTLSCGLALPSQAAQAVSPVSAGPHSAKADLAVGTWSGIVQREEVTDSISIEFYVGGTLCLMTEGGSYLGLWSSSSQNQLSWEAVELIPGGAGNIYVNQKGYTGPHTILTQGITRLEGPNGEPLGSVKATVLLGRDATVTSNCSTGSKK